MPAVPPYDTQGEPFQAKRARSFRFEDRLERQNKTTHAWEPYDLTDVVEVRLRMASDEALRIAEAQTIEVALEIDNAGGLNDQDEDGTPITPNPTTGRVFCEASDDDMDVSTLLRHFCTWLLVFSSGQTDEVPRGRTFRECILGRPLGS
jgi:hypothetical protein